MNDGVGRIGRNDLEYELGRINAALDAIATLLDTGDVSGRGENVGALVGIVADRLADARAEVFRLLEGDPVERSGNVRGGFHPEPFDAGVVAALRRAGIHPDGQSGGVMDAIRRAGIRPDNDGKGQ